MKCLHCKKSFKPKRSDARYCCAACRKAASRAESSTNKAVRLKALQLARTDQHRLRNTRFMQWLIKRIIDHGSIDCLCNQPLEDLYHLWCNRNTLSYLTGTALDICHRTSLKAGGAFTLRNLAILPASFNRSQKDKNMPYGSTYRRRNETPNRDICWKQLQQVYGKALQDFADKHKSMSFTQRFDLTTQLLRLPTSNHTLRGYLEMEDASFNRILVANNFSPITKQEYPPMTNPVDIWVVYRNDLRRQYDVASEANKKLITRFIDSVEALHSDGITVPEEVYESAVVGLVSLALDDLPQHVTEAPYTDDHFLLDDGSKVWLSVTKEHDEPKELKSLPSSSMRKLEIELAKMHKENITIATHIVSLAKTEPDPVAFLLEYREQDYRGDRHPLHPARLQRCLDILNGV